MTVLWVVTEVAKVVGLAAPTTVYGSVDRTEQELAALANTQAKEIAENTHEWTALKTLGTITGDGVTTDFPLPADYRKFLKSATLMSSAFPGNPLYHVTDTNEWLAYETQQFSTVTNRWTLLGTSIVIKPAPVAGSTVKYYYLTKNTAHPVSGANKAEFTIDSDVFLLDEELLKLGMIWRWLDNKGRPYSEKMQNYETALANRIGEDRGPAMMVLGKRRIPSDVTIAYPWTLGP